MHMAAYFPREVYGFDDGAQEFLTFLLALKKLRYFDLEYDSYFGMPFVAQSDFLEGFRANNTEDTPDESIFTIHVGGNDALRPNFTVDYWWGRQAIQLTYAGIDFTHPHPVYDHNIDLFIETIDTVITWKRPQHLRCGPGMYFLNDHPLDKARSGIGWLGWVPFELSHSDVPEAAIILPMHGGTFVASQRDWWIAAGPQRDEAAVHRAQALELRLNHLGVLPTNVELRRGDWGQGTPAR